jgi:hypothetical protein
MNSVMGSSEGFLNEVERVVPSALDVYLVNRLDRDERQACASQSSPASRSRFFTSFLNSDDAWVDEVSHCLGHRRARISRDRIEALETALRRWRRTSKHPKDDFIWTEDSHNIRSAYKRYLANF